MLERNTLVDRGLLAAIPGGLAAFALAAVYTPFVLGLFGVHLAAIAAVLLYSARRSNWFSRPHERHVRASATELVVGDVATPRAQIATGRYQPRPPVNRAAKERAIGSTVQLFDRWNRLVFEAEVASEEEGVALLSALGLDAEQRRAEFSAASPLTLTMGRRLLAGIGSFALFGLLRLFVPLHHTALLLLLLVPVAAALLIRSKLVVGRDGVLWRWLGWKRFVPMADIVRVHPEGTTSIRLELRSGGEEILHLESDKSRGGGIETELRDAAVARIREAHRRGRAGEPSVDVRALVARGARTHEEWKDALAALRDDEAGYRRAALREEDLWRVVEDPHAGEDARAAAAVLLRKGLDAEGRSRVRIAAEASASPRLRVALEAAAADTESDEAAYEALAPLAAKAKKLR